MRPTDHALTRSRHRTRDRRPNQRAPREQVAPLSVIQLGIRRTSMAMSVLMLLTLAMIGLPPPMPLASPDRLAQDLEESPAGSLKDDIGGRLRSCHAEMIDNPRPACQLALRLERHGHGDRIGKVESVLISDRRCQTGGAPSGCRRRTRQDRKSRAGLPPPPQ